MIVVVDFPDTLFENLVRKQITNSAYFRKFPFTSGIFLKPVVSWKMSEILLNQTVLHVVYVKGIFSSDFKTQKIFFSKTYFKRSCSGVNDPDCNDPDCLAKHTFKGPALV